MAATLKYLTDDELFVVQHMTLKFMTTPTSSAGTPSGYRLWCKTARNSGLLNTNIRCDLGSSRSMENKAAYATYLKNLPSAVETSRGGTQLGRLFFMYYNLDAWTKMSMAKAAQRGYILQAKKKGVLSRGCFVGLKDAEIAELYQYYLGAAPSAGKSKIEVCTELTRRLEETLSKTQMAQLFRFISGGKDPMFAPSKPAKSNGKPLSRLEKMYKDNILPGPPSGRMSYADALETFGDDEIDVAGWGGGSVADTTAELKAFQKKWMSDNGSFKRRA